MSADTPRAIVVLDDDPTGAQALAGVEVLIAPDAQAVAAALARVPSVHLLTNSRALTPEGARAAVTAAARAAATGGPGADVVLRGDSTLRAHLLEEYLGLCDAVWAGAHPPLLLVPALPAAGRVTRGTVHFATPDGVPTPVAETEFARDGVFAYASSHLLDWADERSGGFFARDAGRGFLLAELRQPGGAAALAEVLVSLCDAGRPAVCAPDADVDADLEIIADAYRRARAAGCVVAVRCAPAFAGVLAGTTAHAAASPPRATHVLVVCGSYVDTATRQLERLLAAVSREALVEIDVLALAGGRSAEEIARAAAAASASLREHGVAVLATPRERPAELQTLAMGSLVADGLARAAALVTDPVPGVVIAKGGITSAVLVAALGGECAEVVGPLLPGVSLWRFAGRDVVVVPGNVGDDDLLERLVALVREDGAG